MAFPIQWATESHSGRSRKANDARLINLYAEALPADSKSPVILHGTPGTTALVELPTSPIYGLHRMAGENYAITAEALYQVDNDGNYTELATVNIEGVCSVADNGTYIVFVDGVRGYAYSTSAGIYQFSGSGWYAAKTVTYQDGYFIFNRTDTGQFFITTLFGIGLDPLDYAEAEGAPDNTIALLSDHRELWIFGEYSGEVWWNSGDSDFPFERLQGGFVEKGIAAALSLTKLDNTVFWLGHDRIVYRAEGYSPRRVSNHAFEYAIRTGVIDDAIGWSYTDEGHIFYVLTFPTLNITWVYDASTGLWHEREHYVHGRHIANCYVKSDELHLIGDFQSGKVYTMDLDTYDDDGEILKRVAVSPPIPAHEFNSLELDMEAGVGLPTGQGDDPQAMLSWWDNGGLTPSKEHWAPIGKLGERQLRVKWNRLGSPSRAGEIGYRVFRVVISDPVKVAITSAMVEAA